MSSTGSFIMTIYKILITIYSNSTPNAIIFTFAPTGLQNYVSFLFWPIQWVILILGYLDSFSLTEGEWRSSLYAFSMISAGFNSMVTTNIPNPRTPNVIINSIMDGA